MKRAITSVAIAALLALGACSKKTENPPPSGATGSAAAGSAMTAGRAAGSGSAAGSAAGSGSAGEAAGSGSNAAAAGSGSAAAAEVPTEMDFEDDANAKITDKNVEAQVKALEKDLEAK